MIAIAQGFFVKNAGAAGFGFVTLLGLAGAMASLALVQQGVDLTPLIA